MPVCQTNVSENILLQSEGAVKHFALSTDESTRAIALFTNEPHEALLPSFRLIPLSRTVYRIFRDIAKNFVHKLAFWEHYDPGGQENQHCVRPQADVV